MTATATDDRRYRVHHRGSRMRGCLVRVLVRPSSKRRPNNVMVEVLEMAPDDFPGRYTGADAACVGDRIVCPWRGLRRVRT